MKPVSPWCLYHTTHTKRSYNQDDEKFKYTNLNKLILNGESPRSGNIKWSNITTKGNLGPNILEMGNPIKVRAQWCVDCCWCVYTRKGLNG